MLIEKDTTYAYAIKHLQNPSFECIRNVAVNFRKGLSEEDQTELYDMLNRGVDLISNEPQMMMYLHSFGLMHQAKLKYAFEHLPQEFFQQDTIEIIDYGCGQAIGEMVYADYLRSHNISQNVKRITLIEPSETCLKRAALHAKLFFPDAEIRTVCKTFDDLTDEDIATDDDSTKLHILSNVLDIESFSLYEFAALIDYSAQGYNQFVCVGPYFNYSDKDERMDNFAKFLDGIISHSECFDKYEFVQNKSWTCNVCIFEKGKVSKPETYTDEQGVVYGNYGKLLKKAPKELTEYTIPDSVTEIGDEAFCDCSNIQSINIPNSVTEIGWCAFSVCSSLQSITIPNSVIKIGDYAFCDCSNLQSIKVDNNNKNYCADNDVLFNKNRTNLIRCSAKYKTYAIPTSVTEIESGAFSNCRSLQSITIPDSVTEIKEQAFVGCSDLRSITIPNSVTEIGWRAFGGCSSLRNITIPDSVTKIGSDVFEGCSSLQSINIPNSVTDIGMSAFRDCSSLRSINIPNSVIEIGNWAFSGCHSLQSINIPDSVIEIGVWAFGGCSSLQSINIPDSITKIESYVFSGCSSLQSINIPDSVTSIGKEAFDGCSSLKNIKVFKNVNKAVLRQILKDIDSDMERLKKLEEQLPAVEPESPSDNAMPF